MNLVGNPSKHTVTWQRIDHDEGLRPSQRCSFSMCFHYKTKQCLLFGGRNEQGNPFDGKVYSLMVDITDSGVKASWKTLETTDSPGCIANHQCTCVGDAMFLFGGQDSNGRYISDLYKMNIPTGQWSRVHTKGSQPPARTGHAMTAVDTRLYISGGTDENGQLLNDLYVLDLRSLTWTTISIDSSNASGVHGLSLLGMRNTNDDGDLVCVVLGTNGEGSADAVRTYSSKSNTWTSRPIKGDLKDGRSYFTASLLMAGQIFLFGGNGLNGVYNDSYVYHVLSGSWNKLLEHDGIVPLPRSNMAGYKLGLDKLVVFGGLDYRKQCLNDLWLARLHK